jgi:CHAD domain-containing protein
VEVAAEVERKLEAPDGFELPELGGEPLEPRVFSSVYYDTADRSLARAGITLRRRLERGLGLWQLKLPSPDARLELERAGGPATPPPELARLLVAHLRNGPLEPFAELRTRRHGLLVSRKGSTAEVTVDEVAVMDALRVADRFVEVEIELREGNPKRLDEIAREVTEAGARRTNGAPKVFRATGFERPRFRRPDEPFAALRALLRVQLGEILAHDPGTRLGQDPESLHDMRVAVRRSRALLRAGRPLIDDDVRMLRAELKWLGTVLGAVRDLDVLLDRLRSEASSLDADDRTAAGRLLRDLERRRKRARKALLEALDSPRYLRLLRRFEQELETLQPSGEGVTLEVLAKREAKRVRRAARALEGEPADAELHSLRKRVKRMRYAHELAADGAVVRRAKSLQDVLGEHQDSVVAEEWLRTLASDAPPAQALAAGRLIDAERERKREARSGWRRELKRLVAA